jgi:hypothetical protein
MKFFDSLRITGILTFKKISTWISNVSLLGKVYTNYNWYQAFATIRSKKNSMTTELYYAELIEFKNILTQSYFTGNTSLDENKYYILQMEINDEITNLCDSKGSYTAKLPIASQSKVSNSMQISKQSKSKLQFAIDILKSCTSYVINYPAQTITILLATQGMAAAAQSLKLRQPTSGTGEFTVSLLPSVVGLGSDIGLSHLSNNNVIAVWNDFGSLWGQLIAPDGTAIGPNGRFQILSTVIATNGSVPTGQGTSEPHVTPLSNGSFLVCYTVQGRYSATTGFDLYNVYAQAFDSNGNKVGSQFSVTPNYPYYVNDRQGLCSLAANINPGYTLIQWNDQNIGVGSVNGTVYDNQLTSIGNTRYINTLIGVNCPPAIVSLLNQDFISVWCGGGNIYAQRIDSSGNNKNFLFQVNTYRTATNNLDYPDIASLINGNYVTVWQSENQDGSGWGVYGQVFDINDNKIGSEFRVNNYTNSDQARPTVSGLTNGLFVVCWQSQNQTDGLDIFGRVFDAAGNSLGLEFPVNINTVSDQLKPRVTYLDKLGSFMVVWNNVHLLEPDRQDIVGRIFDIEQIILSADNTNLTHIYTQNIPYTFSNQPISIYSLAYSPNIGITLSTSDSVSGNFNTFIFNSARSTYEPTTGTWYASGSISDVNVLLQNLQFTPSLNYYNNFTLSVNIGDNINPNITGTIIMQGIHVNQPPELLVNRLSVRQGKKVILTSNDLNATDIDNPAQDLLFIISNLQNGKFIDINSPSINLDNFTQGEIFNRQIEFVPIGGSISPSYAVSVSDGQLETNPSTAQITFTASSNNNNKAIAGGVAGGVVGVAAVGLAGFGLWRYRQKNVNAKERSQHELANLLRTELKLTNVDDFTSGDGLAFVNAIDIVINELSNQGVDTKQMYANDLKVLSQNLAKGIRGIVGVSPSLLGFGNRIDPAVIQNNAQAIVSNTKNIAEHRLSSPESGLLMTNVADQTRVSRTGTMTL